MKHITKYVVIAIVALIVVLGITNYTKKDTGVRNYKIGVVLPLSGPASALGELSQHSVTLALETLPEEVRSQIEVVYEDDQFDTKKTVTAVTKLIDIDKVDVIVTFSSASSVAASHIAESKEVPLIGLGNSNDINSGKKWATRLIGNPSVYNEALIKLVLDGTYTRPAIIWNQSDGPKAVHDQLLEILPSSIHMVMDEVVAKSEGDFRSSVAKIKASNPDVVISYISPQGGAFAKQAFEGGLSVPQVGYLNFESIDQIKVANGALDNQLYVGNNNIEFISAYYAKFGTYPAVAGDHLFDAITLASNALVASKGDKNEVMGQFKADFTGAAGEYTYMNDGSYDLKNIVVKKWNGEKFVLVK